MWCNVWCIVRCSVRYSVVRPTMSEEGGYARERGDVWGEVVPCVCHHVCITVVRSAVVVMAGVFGRLWSSRMATGPVPSYKPASFGVDGV